MKRAAELNDDHKHAHQDLPRWVPLIIGILGLGLITGAIYVRTVTSANREKIGGLERRVVELCGFTPDAAPCRELPDVVIVPMPTTPPPATSSPAATATVNTPTTTRPTTPVSTTATTARATPPSSSTPPAPPTTSSTPSTTAPPPSSTSTTRRTILPPITLIGAHP